MQNGGIPQLLHTSHLAVDPNNAELTGTLPKSAASSTPYNVTIAVSAHTGPSHATVASNGTFTPPAAYVGNDSFTYVLSNGADKLPANVYITVAGSPSFTLTPASLGTPTIMASGSGSQLNTEGDSVSVSVSASDPNSGATLQYAAVDLPPGLTINYATGLISGTVAPQAAYYNGGSYTVTLLGVDNYGATGSTQVDWSIGAASPTLTSPGNQTNAVGDSVSITLSASQYDSDPLSFDATNLPDGLTIDPDTGIISGTVAPDAVAATPYSITVTATDYTPATPSAASITFNWSVGAGTPSPTLTNPGNQVNAVGDAVDLSLNATDLGGYPLTITATGLPAALSIDPGTGEITGTLPNSAASTAPYTVTVTASDGQVSASDSFTWAVGGVSLTNPGDQDNLNGDSVSLALSATDATSTRLTFSETGLPTDLSINPSTGLISGTPSVTGTDTVTVAASDGLFSDSQTYTWEIDQFAFDQPANQTYREGTSVSFALSATDLAGTPTFTVTGLPSSLTYNAATGSVTGTLASNAHRTGSYPVSVTAVDGASSISHTFVLSITPQLALVNPGPQGFASGDSVSLALSATDYSGGTPTFTASGLPGGLTINAATGDITGTLSTSSGSPYLVTVAASDGTYSDSQTFTCTVLPLYLPTPAGQTNLDDDTVSLSLAADYHGSGSVSYSFTGLPDGLGYNAATGSVSGTLTNTADADGPYTVTETATAGTASVTISFNWKVDPRVTVDAVDNQTNVTGDSVSFAVTAEEASSDSVTWTYGASGLPGGVSINITTGIISGTVTDSPSSSADTITVSASDGIGSASTTFLWSLVPVTFTVPTTEASLGNATVSLALSPDVASGYTAYYTVAGLPPGLSINSSTGVISGTLSSGDTNNTYLVTITASASGISTSQEFDWTVGTVVVAPIADQTNTEGDVISLSVVAGSVSGTLTYSALGLPGGLTINSATGAITGTLGATTAVDGPFETWEQGGGVTWDGPDQPGEYDLVRGISTFVVTGTQSAGDYTITVIASNGTVSASQSFAWTVTPKITVTAIADQVNVEGDSVSVPVTASEGSATLSFSATGLPNGLTINSATGLISGTVATGDSSVGTYAVDVTVGDGTYSSDVYIAWAIHRFGNHAPTLTNPGTQTSTVGDNVTLSISAGDLDGDALAYSVAGLPDGLSIDPNTGIISGTVAEDALQTAPYTITVSVDDNNGGDASTTFSWLVNDSALSITPATFAGSAGADAGNATIATFTTTDPNWDPSEFTATITWGDGSSDQGEVDGTNGVYTVSDDHVYAHAGSYAPQISVTDGYLTSLAVGSATISASTITANGGVMIGAVGGISVSGTWASFTDTNLLTTAGDYTATINWGDGSSTINGTVTGSNGDFVVSGSHSYANDGTDTVTVTINGQDSTTASTTSTAQVGDLYAGESATMTVATFTVADITEPASAYTAIVNWGDGSATTTGTVTGSAGSFTVTGTHTYTTDSLDAPNGVDTVTVTLVGPNETTLNSSGNQTLTATKAVSVVRPPLTGYLNESLANSSTSFTNAEVATFTVPNASDNTSEFAATINWGDGTSSSATVTGSNGLFQVLGSHTYAACSNAPVQIDIEQAWNASSVGLILISLPNTSYVLADQDSGGGVFIKSTFNPNEYIQIDPQINPGRYDVVTTRVKNAKNGNTALLLATGVSLVPEQRWLQSQMLSILNAMIVAGKTSKTQWKYDSANALIQDLLFRANIVLNMEAESVNRPPATVVPPRPFEFPPPIQAPLVSAILNLQNAVIQAPNPQARTAALAALSAKYAAEGQQAIVNAFNTAQEQQWLPSQGARKGLAPTGWTLKSFTLADIKNGVQLQPQYTMNATTDPYTAIQNLWTDQFQVDCITGTQIAYWKALADTLGQTAFNERFVTDGKLNKKIMLGYTNIVGVNLTTLPAPKPAPGPWTLDPTYKQPALPGDWYNFSNLLDYRTNHPTGIWAGESTVLVSTTQPIIARPTSKLTSIAGQMTVTGMGVPTQSGWKLIRELLNQYSITPDPKKPVPLDIKKGPYVTQDATLIADLNANDPGDANLQAAIQTLNFKNVVINALVPWSANNQVSTLDLTLMPSRLAFPNVNYGTQKM